MTPDEIARIITDDPDVFLLDESKRLEKFITKALAKKYGQDFDTKSFQPRVSLDPRILAMLKDSIYNIVNDETIREVLDPKWLAIQLIKQPDFLAIDWQSIVDFLRNTPNAQYDSVEDLINQSNFWIITRKPSSGPTSEGGEELIHSFPNGYKLVELKTKEQLSYEGELMNHCVGDYSPSSKFRVLSLRDRFNKPHVTISFSLPDRSPLYLPYKIAGARRQYAPIKLAIEQIKGKNNRPPIPKYAKMVMPWLDANHSFPDEYTSEGKSDYIKSIWDISKLEEMYKDDRTHYHLAGNPNTPLSLLQQLATNEKNRLSLATNPSFPLEIVYDWIRQERINKKQHRNSITVFAIPRIKDAKFLEFIMDTLVPGGDYNVAEALANKKSLPSHLLEKLARHIKTYDPSVEKDLFGNVAFE